MKKIGPFLLLLVLFGLLTPAFSEPVPVLEKLKALEGRWEGTLKWTGARTGEGTLTAVYSTTGNGSAVVEDLIMEGKKVMTSVYHMDGETLRMTHYCGAGNQPRLKAVSYQEVTGKISFEMVDITNLKSPEAGHVAGAELVLLGPDQISISFLFEGAGKKSTEFIQLHRAWNKSITACDHFFLRITHQLI